MATKVKSKTPDPVAEAPAAGGSKKKMIIIIMAAVLAASAAAGGAAWYFSRKAGAAPAQEREEKHVGPAIFIPLEPFTVNLQTKDIDQFLQVTIHLQVTDPKTVELFKSNVAVVRNRILILLSSKMAAEISSVEGKTKLANEIVELMKEPFTHGGKPQDVTGALFTAFIIQ